jgi:hypothetical protein
LGSCDFEGEKDAYKLLYPEWSTYVAGNMGRFDEDPLWNLRVIPGHIVGRIKAATAEPCQDQLSQPAATQALVSSGASTESRVEPE